MSVACPPFPLCASLCRVPCVPSPGSASLVQTCVPTRFTPHMPRTVSLNEPFTQQLSNNKTCFTLSRASAACHF
eukprot:7118352-Prymnesium_polylepis.1